MAGGVALGGLAVVREDAMSIWNGLTHGGGLAAVAVSAAAGVGTMALVGRNRFEPARATAALAVAAIVVGWAIAQSPQFLPGLTVTEAAAGQDDSRCRSRSVLMVFVHQPWARVLGVLLLLAFVFARLIALAPAPLARRD